MEPILQCFRRIQPTVISLAFDPEGSGPDTHYKVLQAIAEALRQWSLEKDLSDSEDNRLPECVVQVPALRGQRVCAGVA
ncbi:MAG: hypothetical protein MZV63_21385 [Marinilabiliales bacterium]|nr:hypothetical protein [Marinilabiliales bacterium]